MMKNLYWILVFLVYSLPGQVSRVDSLEMEIAKNQFSDKEKIAAHLELCKLYYQLNLDSMISHANHAFNLAEKNDFKAELAETYKFFGISHWRVGENREALDDYQMSLSIYESINDFSGISKMLGNISSLYRRLGKYDSALYYQNSSIKMKEGLGDQRGIAISLLNIAQIYRTIGMLDSTQTSFNRAFPIIEELEETELELKLYLDQSDLYYIQGDTSKAISFIQHAIELGRTENILVHLADATNNLAEIYIDIKDFSKAIGLLEESISISDEINNPLPKAIAESNLGFIYIELGQLNMAKRKFESSYNIFSEFEEESQLMGVQIGFAKIAQIQNLESEALNYLNSALLIANDLKEYGKSSQIIEMMISIYDKIYTRDVQNNQPLTNAIYWRDSLNVMNELHLNQIQSEDLQKLQIEFSVAEMESKVKALELDAKIESEKVQKYRIVSGSLAIGILLMFGLIFYLRRSKVVKIENDELRRESVSEKLEHKERELFTSAMLLIRKNEEMNLVKKQLEEISSDVDHAGIKKVIKNIDQGSRLEKDWEVFRIHFENANEGFLKRLAEKHGNLSASEVRLCTFIKMNMSNKEIAELNHVSLHAVEKSRSRLRKKIGLHSGEDLFQWVYSV